MCVCVSERGAAWEEPLCRFDDEAPNSVFHRVGPQIASSMGCIVRAEPGDKAIVVYFSLAREHF